MQYHYKALHMAALEVGISAEEWEWFVQGTSPVIIGSALCVRRLSDCIYARRNESENCYVYQHLSVMKHSCTNILDSKTEFLNIILPRILASLLFPLAAYSGKRTCPLCH
ncbi:hypothetical protein HNR77_000045 [Paenibacillus sp. JGP012]|nr:hypothetical protein [Paenibacillus sp. JGP012]